MKQLVMGITIMIVTILGTFSIWILGEQQVREEELRTALNRAMEQTMQVYVEKRNAEEVCTEEWMKEEFTDRFLVQIKNRSTLDICFYTIDTEKGLLDVEVAETYTLLTGQPKTIYMRKTLICE